MAHLPFLPRPAALPCRSLAESSSIERKLRFQDGSVLGSLTFRMACCRVHCVAVRELEMGIGFDIRQHRQYL